MQFRASLPLAGLALLLSASIASAGPKNDAGKLFAEGLRLYAEKNYEEASVALEAAYEAKAEQRTLFAWAQAVRLSGQCDKGRELLAQYVANGANAKQSRAAFKLMEDCESTENSGDDKDGVATTTVADTPSADPDTPSADPDTPPVDPRAAGVSEPPSSSRPPPPPRATATPWYKDWVAVGLFSTGAIGLAISGLSYSNALTLESEAEEFGTTYDEFSDLKTRSQDNRNVSVITGVAGGLLVGAGVTYLVLRKSPSDSEAPVALQLGSDSAGFTFSGHF